MEFSVVIALDIRTHHNFKIHFVVLREMDLQISSLIYQFIFRNKSRPEWGAGVRTLRVPRWRPGRTGAVRGPLDTFEGLGSPYWYR